jgi:hypothetical protein
MMYLKSSDVATDDIPIIHGHNISCRKFSKRQRGQLAIEVIKGRATATGLSTRQIARVFSVPPSYLRAMLDGLHYRDDLLDTVLKLDPGDTPNADRLGTKRGAPV